MQDMQVGSLSGEDPLEKEIAAHSSILAWKIPWTEEPGGLQPMGSQNRHNLVIKQHQQMNSETICSLKFILWNLINTAKGFPDNSVGKESACNARDPSLISGWGRSTGEGIGYPLQYSWASLVTQLVKNPPAMRETWVRPLGWEDSPGKGKGCLL